jgi:hypothetical protein
MSSNWRNASCLIWLAAGWLTPGLMVAGVPVEGDTEAIQLVRDVQADNLTAFPRGGLSFRAVWHHFGNTGKHELVEHRYTWAGKVQWNGDRSYWDVREELDIRPNDGEWESAQARKSTRKIFTPQALYGYTYSNSDSRVPLSAFKTFEDAPIDWQPLSVLPQQVWFRTEVPFLGSEVGWAQLFDPEFNVKNTAKIVVSRPDTDQIVITRHPNKGPPRTTTCSLAAGGNVIRSDHPYWADAPKGFSRYGDTLTYEWLPLDGGRYRLKRLEHTSSNPEARLDLIYRLEIEDFDPNPPIAQNRFTFESLEVPDGTKLYERRNGVRTQSILGKPAPAGVSQDVLDRLSEEARQGFAKPQP